MTDREVMQMALEALAYTLDTKHEHFDVDKAQLLSHRAVEHLQQALAQPEQEKESTVCAVDSRLLLGRSNNFTKETENRLCDIERRLAVIETQPALAQPEQEPVAWKKSYDIVCALLRQAHDILATTQYPIKREWVGLTVEERRRYNDRLSGSGVAEEIEVKLKEKNGG